MAEPTVTTTSNRRGLAVFAAILTAALLTVWGGTQWENHRQDQRVDQEVDQLVDDLCATTPDC